MRRTRIFLAAPLVLKRQQAFNARIAQQLEVPFDVFLPQRDVGLISRMIAEGMSSIDAWGKVFDEDLHGIRQSDIIVAVFDGSAISGGVAAELGLGFAMGKICVALETKRRVSMEHAKHSPILESMLVARFDLLENLIDFVRTLPNPSRRHSFHSHRSSINGVGGRFKS